MSDFLSRIENFLFDILGLILPGVIFLLILISPISFINTTKIPDHTLSSSFTLSGIVTLFNILKIYWATNLNITLVILIIASYLVGHTIKVSSIIVYELLTTIFDKFLNKIVLYLFGIVVIVFNYFSRLIIKKDFEQTFLGRYIVILLTPIRNTISKIFTFNSDNYFTSNENMKTECVALINQRLNTSYPNVWYSIYKLSMVIQQQEGIKSLAATFLAKYNLYRSLSFIFIFTTFYYYVFFLAAAKYISPELTKITSLLLYSSVILWFTFHYKYKRYWTLCGNETLVSLYYFLNKEKINEVG